MVRKRALAIVVAIVVPTALPASTTGSAAPSRQRSATRVGACSAGDVVCLVVLGPRRVVAGHWFEATFEVRRTSRLPIKDGQIDYWVPPGARVKSLQPHTIQPTTNGEPGDYDVWSVPRINDGRIHLIRVEVKAPPWPLWSGTYGYCPQTYFYDHGMQAVITWQQPCPRYLRK